MMTTTFKIKGQNKISVFTIFIESVSYTRSSNGVYIFLNNSNFVDSNEIL